jgi:hypothetical protein
MTHDDYVELRKAAKLMMQVRCILEGISESIDSGDAMFESISDSLMDANNLEYQLDYIVENAGE